MFLSETGAEFCQRIFFMCRDNYMTFILRSIRMVYESVLFWLQKRNVTVNRWVGSAPQSRNNQNSNEIKLRKTSLYHCIYTFFLTKFDTFFSRNSCKKETVQILVVSFSLLHTTVHHQNYIEQGRWGFFLPRVGLRWGWSRQCDFGSPDLFC